MFVYVATLLVCRVKVRLSLNQEVMFQGPTWGQLGRSGALVIYNEVTVKRFLRIECRGFGRSSWMKKSALKRGRS